MPQRVDVAVEGGLVALPGDEGTGLADQLAERDDVQLVGACCEQVAVTPAQQVRARRPGGETGLEQPPQRADVLVEDVARAGGGVVVPHQVDELLPADRLPRPGDQQGKQVGLLPRAGVQFHAVPPHPEGAEDLQVQPR